MEISQSARRRLHIQGFESVDDSELARTGQWLRFTPALCGFIVAFGTLLATPWVFFLLAPVAAFGAAFPVHPFDLLYNYGLRHLTDNPPLPPNGAPRRFACGVASVWMIAIGLSVAAGAPVAGSALGALMTVVIALVATTHICIPSMIFRAGCRVAGARAL
jgi:hypothetical protein